MTDGWAAYEHLEEFGGGGVYVHDTIIHNENFVVADIHTQSAESLEKGEGKAEKRERNK